MQEWQQLELRRRQDWVLLPVGTCEQTDRVFFTVATSRLQKSSSGGLPGAHVQLKRAEIGVRACALACAVGRAARDADGRIKTAHS